MSDPKITQQWIKNYALRHGFIVVGSIKLAKYIAIRPERNAVLLYNGRDHAERASAAWDLKTGERVV